MATIPQFRQNVPTSYDEYLGYQASPYLANTNQWNVGDGSNVVGPLGSGFASLGSYGMPSPDISLTGVDSFGGMPISGMNLAASTPTPASTGFLSQLGDWARSSGLVGSVDPKTNIRTDGWGALALGAGSALFNGFLGMKQYGIAKDTLEQNKRQFKLNYEAQRSMTNSALEDRQRRRMQERPDLAMPVADYMSKWGVK